MKIELYFLKYAFPCAFITLQRGKIDRRTYDRLEKAAVSNKVLPRKLLERIFSVAFARMDKLAREKSCRVWSFDLIRDYYWRRHNRLIMQGEGSYGKAPKILRELCKVLPGATEKGGRLRAVIRLKGGKKRAVMTDLVGPLKKGDRVMVHYGYAVERLS